MSALLNGLKEITNFGYTENGATKHLSTLNDVLDLFAMGGAYRKRTDKEVTQLFGNAYREDRSLAMKCLFYLRDIRGGQGERRFFRVAYKWLVENDLATAKLNMNLIPEYGRWDDLIDIAYATSPALDKEFIELISNQMDLDAESKTPSLLAKWMPSENASSKETKSKAKWIMSLLPAVSPRDYRKRLSAVRQKINVLERLMSANEWDKIEFDKIPSVAGMKYKNTFAVKEVTAARYKVFMANKETKVNAAVLNPVDIVDKILRHKCRSYWQAPNGADFSSVDIDTFQKYWDNLKDYYQGREENAIAVVDVSGSMSGTPMAAAIGMGAYVAEKSHGPFAGYFITFSSKPSLVKFQGDNIVDKVLNCHDANWGMSTNIEATMDLILSTAVKKRLSQDDLPARLYIFSDMEFDTAVRIPYRDADNARATLFEDIEKKWNRLGYKMPKVIFWNLDARTRNIPAIGDSFSYISGFSMSQMEAVMAGKTAVEMMLDVLNGERYEAVKA